MEKLFGEIEGLGDLNLNLLGHSEWSFNFSRMLHNSLCPRTNTAVETALTKQSPLPYPNNLFLLETQKHENQWLLNEFEEMNLN
jgi:hypothetical protein